MHTVEDVIATILALSALIAVAFAALTNEGGQSLPAVRDQIRHELEAYGQANP